MGSKADMTERICNVRFTPESGHRSATRQYALCAKSGHQFRLEGDCPKGRTIFCSAPAAAPYATFKSMLIAII